MPVTSSAYLTKRLIGAAKTAMHHLGQEVVCLFQAEDLLQDQAIENSQGARDLKAEGTTECSGLPIIGEHEGLARNSYRNAGRFSGPQIPAELVGLSLLSLRQIDDREPRPIASRNQPPADAQIQLVPDLDRSREIWVRRPQEVGPPDLSKVAQDRRVCEG